MSIVNCNDRALRLLQFGRDELVGRAVRDILPAQMQNVAAFVQRVMFDGQGWTNEVSCTTRRGDSIPVEISAARLSVGGQPNILTIVRDLREQRRAESHIRALVYRDTLTGLPNRTMLYESLERAVAYAKRRGSMVTLLVVDIDHFKYINDSLGHSVGDALLNVAGRRLHGVMGGDDTVARLGGDEFVVLVNELGRDRDTVKQRVADVANKLKATFHRPVIVGEHQLHVTVSIGVAVFPEDGDCVEELLRRADSAMYRAKHSGRDAIQRFTHEMDAAAAGHLKLINTLRTAPDRDAFYLVYQPQVSLAENRVVGYEALLRLKGDECVSPVEFIPLLEQTELIITVGDWVVEQAAQTLRDAIAQGRCSSDTFIAVNISPRQFAKNVFVRRLKQTLDRVGLPTGNLELEITEGLLIQDKDSVISRMQEVRHLGIRVAVDDFGTGYSSLAYLKQLPINILKIDQSFVQDINTDLNDAAIVETIIAMAKVMGLGVVAEGVETYAHAQSILALGCERAQGYFFGRPHIELAADTNRVVVRRPTPSA